MTTSALSHNLVSDRENNRTDIQEAVNHATPSVYAVGSPVADECYRFIHWSPFTSTANTRAVHPKPPACPPQSRREKSTVQHKQPTAHGSLDVPLECASGSCNTPSLLDDQPPCLTKMDNTRPSSERSPCPAQPPPADDHDDGATPRPANNWPGRTKRYLERVLYLAPPVIPPDFTTGTVPSLTKEGKLSPDLPRTEKGLVKRMMCPCGEQVLHDYESVREHIVECHIPKGVKFAYNARVHCPFYVREVTEEEPEEGEVLLDDSIGQSVYTRCSKFYSTSEDPCTQLKDGSLKGTLCASVSTIVRHVLSAHYKLGNACSGCGE